MIARLASVALDARFATRSLDPAELARAARWIAENALAARGVRVEGPRDDDAAPAIVEIHAADLDELLAAVAQVPCLVDADSVPLRWRAALRLLGIPILDGDAEDALARGASVGVVHAA